MGLFNFLKDGNYEEQNISLVVSFMKEEFEFHFKELERLNEFSLERVIVGGSVFYAQSILLELFTKENNFFLDNYVSSVNRGQIKKITNILIKDYFAKIAILKDVDFSKINKTKLVTLVDKILKINDQEIYLFLSTERKINIVKSAEKINSRIKEIENILNRNIFGLLYNKTCADIFKQVAMPLIISLGR